MGQRLLRAAASVKPSRSHLMMGGGSIAGLFQPCPEAIAVDTVRAALTSGITSFDTAPHYGLGVSEERIGMGMSALGNELCSPAMRDAASDRAIRELKELGAVQLWTKSGRIICAAGTPGAVLQAGGTDITGVTYYDLLTNASRERDQIFDYTAEGAARSLDASEARFGHRVAGLRVHDADTDELVDDCLAPGGMLEGLRALREAGRIDSVSLGMNMVVAPQILRLLREAPAATFDNIMLAHGWNLLCQDGLEVMKECAAQGETPASLQLRANSPAEHGNVRGAVSQLLSRNDPFYLRPHPSY
jgi:D-threo-aldose 1-dehydrogenase